MGTIMKRIKKEEMVFQSLLSRTLYLHQITVYSYLFPFFLRVLGSAYGIKFPVVSDYL